jgi:hypothetical protein
MCFAIVGKGGSRYRVAVRITLPAALAVLLASHRAMALEPWVDPDPDKPPARYEIGAVGVAAEAEYRAQFIYVNPLSLTTEEQDKYSVIEHRLRVGGTVDYDEKVKLVTSFDLFDSVLFGDNGSFGGEPAADSGLKATIRNPNVAKACMKPLAGGDPLSPSGYGWGLCDTAILKVRRLYAQVSTPIGAIRVGRQAVAIGMGVQNSDGDGRRNRFGVAYGGDSVDRILFATKPLEGLKPKEQRNLDENDGLLVVATYDRLATADPTLFTDDVNQAAVAMRFLKPEFAAGRDLELLSYYSHRWNSQYNTRINTVGGRASAKFSKLHVGIDVAGNVGTTQEVSTAYSLITNDPVVTQPIVQLGGRAAVRWDEPSFTAYLEFDYASGDPDPRSLRPEQDGTNTVDPLSQFRFSEDSNVGLLMFEHAVGFQSARASAAAVEITRRLGAVTFPAERINTRGSFTDALAIFPQVDVRPHQSVLLRAGALVAWAPAPLLDPVQSLTHKDGHEIEDDLVNFVGGAPGTFYGVELDGRVQWRLFDHFALDLEGAVLFPGNALQDANGKASKSMLLQGRTSFFF